MENRLADLSLNDDEDEILQIQIDSVASKERGEFQLVECFLTASIVHFPAMKSTIANLWHPIREVQIRDLGEKKVLIPILSRYGHGSGSQGVTMDLQQPFIRSSQIIVWRGSSKGAINLYPFLGSNS